MNNKNGSTIQPFSHSDSSDVVIKVENVSKKYCKSLKSSMIYGMQDIIRNSIGLSAHSELLRKSEFWAIDGLSFELKKGETLGVIGPNGAGKTTLLKMLNGIFWPDKGKVTIKGKVGALIEVGAGFHPALTGRENIYINGAILGMSKKEIDEKFGSIVDFADIGDFLDTPVKNYSSGMYVRLGFAVAIHSESDILLIDEILAVGDVRFQSKCLNYLTNNLLKKGCSIIFVSHNRYAVQDVCELSLYIEQGRMIQFGKTAEVIESYLDNIRRQEMDTDISITHKKENAGITRVEFIDEQGNVRYKYKSGEKVRARLYYSFKEQVQKPSVGITFIHSDQRYSLVSSTDYIFNLHSGYDGFEVQTLSGKGFFEVVLDCLYAPVGVYRIFIYLFKDNNMNLVQKTENACKIEILWRDDNSSKRSLIDLPHKWSLTRE